MERFSINFFKICFKAPFRIESTKYPYLFNWLWVLLY